MRQQFAESLVDSPWEVWEPTAAEPWDIRRVRHCYRRAGFAAGWEALTAGVDLGHESLIDSFLDGTANQAATPPQFDQLAEVIGNSAVSSNQPRRLQAWWVYRCLFSPDPLRERLSLLWHHHFATSNEKVADLGLMKLQLDSIRRCCDGAYGDLLRAVVRHPATLIWLDADQNRKGSPNENLARELMELFSIGRGHYHEDDVKEAARALTGWSVVGGRFQFQVEHHDQAEKTILGQTGQFDGDDLLMILLEHDGTAERLAKRLCELFFGIAAVPSESIAELAAGLKTEGLNIRWGVETILRSRMFFSADHIGTRVLSPIEFSLGLIRMLRLDIPPPSTLRLAERISEMGQRLFYPPNVFGWPEGREWITSRTMVSRSNFVAELMQGELHEPKRLPFSVAHLEALGGAADDIDWQQLKLLIEQTIDEPTAMTNEPLDKPEQETNHLSSDSLRAWVAEQLLTPQSHLG